LCKKNRMNLQWIKLHLNRRIILAIVSVWVDGGL
jgi:hypothetical protein